MCEVLRLRHFPSVKTIFHYIYIFSPNFHIFAFSVGEFSCGRMESSGSCCACAFCFHFYGNAAKTLIPAFPFRHFTPASPLICSPLLTVHFPATHSGALKCRFIRISYVSILNRLFMFEFYFIVFFYAWHRPHFGPFCFAWFYFSGVLDSSGYIKFRKLYAKSGPPTLNSQLWTLSWLY